MTDDVDDDGFVSISKSEVYACLKSVSKDVAKIGNQLENMSNRMERLEKYYQDELTSMKRWIHYILPGMIISSFLLLLHMYRG